MKKIIFTILLATSFSTFAGTLSCSVKVNGQSIAEMQKKQEITIKDKSLGHKNDFIAYSANGSVFGEIDGLRLKDRVTGMEVETVDISSDFVSQVGKDKERQLTLRSYDGGLLGQSDVTEVKLICNLED